MCKLRDLEPEAIVDEINNVLKYSGRVDGAVKRIAALMNLQPRTIYDYLDGRIKPSLRFLHAAVIASDGDPDIKKFLEPEGYKLALEEVGIPDKQSLAEECLDDLPALADFHKVLNDPAAREVDVKRAMDLCVRDLKEDLNLWREGRRRHVTAKGVIALK